MEDATHLTSARPSSQDPITMRDAWLPHRFRWALILLQSYFSFISSVAIMCYFPIVPFVADDMGVSVHSITLLEMTVWLLSASWKLPAMWFTANHGPIRSLTVGVAGIVIGGGIRVVPHSFFLFVSGTVLCQIGQTFVQVLPALITEQYFPDGEKSLATSIGVVSEYFGVGIGMFIGSQFVGNLDALWFSTAFLCVLGIPGFIFVYKHVDNRMTAKKNDIRSTVYELFCHQVFRRCFIGLGLIFGVFNTMLSNIASIAPPSMAHKMVGVYALILFCFGMVGAVVISYLMDRYALRPFKVIAVSAASCFIFLFIQCIFWVHDISWGVLVTTAGVGFFGPPLPSIIIRHLIESIDCQGLEAVMNALLLISYTITAGVLTPICTPESLRMEAPNNVYIIWILMIVSLPGLVLLFFIRPLRTRREDDMEMPTVSTNLVGTTSQASS